MTDKLITIASFSTPYEANMVKSELEANEIPAFVADEHTIGMNWLYSNALGGVKVQVPETFVQQAKELLSSAPAFEADQPEVEMVSCPKCGSKGTEEFVDKKGPFLSWLLFGLPLLFPKTKHKCCSCGSTWE